MSFFAKITPQRFPYFHGLAAGLLLLNLIILCIGYYSYSYEYEQLQQQKHMRLTTLQNTLDELMNFSFRETQRIHEEVLKSDRSLSSVYEILRQRVDMGQGIVRFGWSNKHEHLTATSGRGIYNPPLNISGRQYVRHARLFPGNLYISRILKHLRSKREIVVVALGIADDSGEYIGNIAAVINLEPLRLWVHKQMADTEIEYLILSPHNEPMDSHGAIDSLLKLKPVKEVERWRFKTIGRVAPDAINTLRRDAFTGNLLLITLINLAAFALYRLIHTRILRPVASTMRALMPYAPGSTPGGAPGGVFAGAGAPGRKPDSHAGGGLSLADSLHHLNALAEEWHSAQTRLQEQDALIHELIDTLNELQHQQARFLEASSAEMREMFETVCAYARHLEDMVMHQQLHPDAPYDFDDVREMGANLKHLSECYLLFCEKATGQTELVDPRRVIDTCLSELQDAIERRNLHLSLSHQREVWLVQKNTRQVLHAIIRSVLYAAIRHAEDEAALHTIITTEGETILLRFTVSRFRTARLSEREQTAAQSKADTLHEAIRAYLERHANLLVADSLLAQFNGRLRVESSEGETGFTLKLYLHSLVQRPA